MDCGVDDPDVLEFDHVGEKNANVSWLVYQGASARRVQSEIDRCEIVCVNCHRCRTAKRSRSWRHDPAVLRERSLTPGQRRNLMWIMGLLEAGECADCGENRLARLEFDHVGEKTGHVVSLARSGITLARLRAEVSRCELVCANCHRKRTRARLRAARRTRNTEDQRTA